MSQWTLVIVLQPYNHIGLGFQFLYPSRSFTIHISNFALVSILKHGHTLSMFKMYKVHWSMLALPIHSFAMPNGFLFFFLL